MDTDDALAFLKAHQPLPPDKALDQPLIEAFDAVRLHFAAHPDPRCIPLFLGAFGSGSGFGVFQLCDEVFSHFRPEDLSPQLQAAIRSLHPGTRGWAVEWAMLYPHPSLLPALQERLEAEVPEDEDSRPFVVAAVETIWLTFQTARALELLLALKASDPRPHVREITDRLP